MHDLLRRLSELDRHLLAALHHLTSPSPGPEWHQLPAAARAVRRRWLLRALPATVLASLLLSALGTTSPATTAPLGELGALAVALLPLVVLLAAYRRRFEAVHVVEGDRHD